MFDLEAKIQSWKRYLYENGSYDVIALDALEEKLRSDLSVLEQTGLDGEEAFIISTRRISAAEQRFVIPPVETVWPRLQTADVGYRKREMIFVVGLALLGGLLGKFPALFGYGDIDTYGLIYMKNAALFALFPIAIYYIWKRSLPIPRSLVYLAAFPIAALFVNLYPSYEPHHTSLLMVLHLPISLLYIMMYFYGGPNKKYNRDQSITTSSIGWTEPETRLNYIRCVGETFIHTILIVLGAMVLIGLTVGTFDLIKIDISGFLTTWILPFGLFGIAMIAVYLVEQKKALHEGIAPILAKIFIPLFLIVIVSLIVAFLITPNAAIEQRTLLLWFDIIIAFVLALNLYAMSAKDQAYPDKSKFWDILTFAMVIAAIIADLIALSGILIRLSSYGISANKLAVLGENVIMLVNLVLLAIHDGRYMAKKDKYKNVVVMQMKFLDAYAIWATFVVIAFGPLFGFR